MTTVTATDFAKNFGRLSREAERGPIAISSHGVVTGYYVSARDFEALKPAPSPAYKPLLPQLRARRDELIALAERYGASNLRVFGSVARGEDGPGSDIDFLVSFPEKYSLFDQRIGLMQEFEDLFGCKIDLLPERELDKSSLRDRILAEAVTL